MPGKLRRSGRGVLEKRWQSLEERGSAGAQLGHPMLARSKTCDPSFYEAEEAAAGGQGHRSPSLSKRTAGYRKAFGELAERDALLACFSCAWQREVPYHGRLYISSRHLCFHSSLLLKDIKVVVPIASISALKKTNTVLLVPNALSIRTVTGEKFLFVSLRRREATYQLLKSLCKHLQDNSWSPLSSPSAAEILRKPLTSSQSDLEQSTLEPDSPRELPGEQPPAARAPLACSRPCLCSRTRPCPHFCPTAGERRVSTSWPCGSPPWSWGAHPPSLSHTQLGRAQRRGKRRRRRRRRRRRMKIRRCWLRAAVSGCPWQSHTGAGGDPRPWHS
ncbi:uncharacterized protein VSU04_014737 isoform 2-T2 [Chlamydotis macqueenii]